MVDSAFVTNPGLFKDKLPYDTRRDFIPVSLLSRTQLVLSVSPSSPFKTAQELIAFAKANPGKLTFASAGIGTGIHLAAEQFRQVTGIEIVIIPYRGGAPALADFLSGKVDFTFGAVPSIREHMLAGRARGLGMTRGRAPQLPDIPSMEELGYASVDSASEMGLIVPAATPAPIVERLQQVAANTVKNPAFSQSLLERGFSRSAARRKSFARTSTARSKNGSASSRPEISSRSSCALAVAGLSPQPRCPAPRSSSPAARSPGR